MAALGVGHSSIFRAEARVAQALHVLDRYEPSQALDEGGLAGAVGLSVSQLNRLFAAQIGMTPRGYFQQRRLDLAKQALLSMHLPVKQVAYMVGFKHASHFCRWFARQTGHRPGAFREGPIRGNVQ